MTKPWASKPWASKPWASKPRMTKPRMTKPGMTESGMTRKLGTISSWVAIVLALAYPILLVAVAHVQSGGQDSFPLDDPWIHLTFARNLQEHGAFTYFPGTQSSGGSTAPLYTMLLAVGFFFTSDEKWLSYVLGLAAQLFFLIFLARWVRARLVRPESGHESSVMSISPWMALLPALAVLVVGLDSRVGILAVSGMETSLYLALISLAFWGRASGRNLLFGAGLGASLWVRPDSLLLLVVFAIDLALDRWKHARRTSERHPAKQARNQKKASSAATSAATAAGVTPVKSERTGVLGWVRSSPWGGMALAAAIATLYVVFHLALFGHPLPNTFAAKTTYYQEVPHSAFLLHDIPEAFWTGGWILLSLLAVVAIVRELVSWITGRAPRLRAETGWVLALTLAYLVLLPFSHRFSRYLIPALPAIAILALSALRMLMASPLRPLRLLPAVIAAVCLVLQARGAYSSIEEYQGICLYHWARHERAGRWLAEKTPESAVVATHDIGAIAYYSHRRVVDIVGILDPEIVPHLGTPEYIPRVREILEREGVTHLAVLRNWLEVSNAEPLFVATPEPEILEIFAWDRSVHLVPKPASALAAMGASLLEARDLAGAQTALRNSLRFDPENSRAWYLLAVTEEMSSDYENAIEHYRKTWEIFPRHYDARYREAQVQLAAGNKLEAARAFHRLLDINPDYPTALDRFLALRRELGPAAELIVQER